MIKKIESIKDFGIYKNFKWNSSPNIKDFNKKNLFYGWNYSGKTTLSRIFSSLRDKKLHDSYKKGEFKIETTDGEFSNINLDSFPYDILVFNSDYIKDNLNFSIHEDSITESSTILFEVGDNAKHEAKITQLNRQIEAINGSNKVVGKKTKYEKDLAEFESYDTPNSGKFTSFSRKIQDEDFLSLIRFTKVNLKPIISNVKRDLNEHIINDKKSLATLSEIVKIGEPKEELSNIQINLHYPEIIEKTNWILQSTPDREVVNKILDNSSEAYSWVKKGLVLNKANSKCLYCDNVVNKARVEFLNQYFSSQASNLIEQVDELKQIISEEERNINSINLPSSSNDFNLGFIRKYDILKRQYQKIVLDYKKHLKDILLKVENKISKSLYTSIPNVTPFKVEVFTALIFEINDLILSNNEFSSDFENKITVERDKLKNHLVSSFLKSEKYLAKEKKYNKAIIEIEKLDKIINTYEKEIRRYESLKSSDKEGAEQYTYFIQSFLNRTDIEIKLDQGTGKFILLRSNENASNLSEGEKTAIAFSHFLVTIKSLVSKGKFINFIVFVDDPISSLDGNHIFQINSLLKDTFFFKDSDGEYKIKCKQLFFSSHNFEFFNLLKELPVNNKKESRYFIERNIMLNIADIKTLPEIFDKYSSEYHYLFKEILDFNKLRKPLNSEKLLLIPNILRRFLEMYTLTKYPSKDSVDRRADKIFTPELSKRICKPFHYFSHLDNIDRIGKQSEFMADIPVACKTLINYIKRKDKLHYEALLNAVNL